MPILRVQTSARIITVRLHTRGRAPACWHYCFSYKGRHRGSTETTELPAAQAAARLAVLDVVANTAVAGSLPLPAAIAAYLAGRWPGLDTTQPRYSLPRRYLEADEKLNRFDAWCRAHAGGVPNLAALDLDRTTALIQRHLDARKQTCAAQTVLSDARMLSAFWSYLLRTATLKASLRYRENPASKHLLVLESVPRRPLPPASMDHIESLIEHGRRSRAWPAILLCLTAGFRPIGATRVHWADVDLERRTLAVEEKNARRNVLIPTWVADELRAWRRAHPTDETICPGNRHKLTWAMKYLRRQLGLPDNVTLQSLRRSFISRCMDAGINVATVAGVAGNSPAVIARHYKDLSTLNAQNVVDAMEGLSMNLPQNLPHAKSRKVVNP